jgi:hypothetical protein
MKIGREERQQGRHDEKLGPNNKHGEPTDSQLGRRGDRVDPHS